MGEIPSTGTIGKEIPFTATTILSKDSSGDYREIGDGASLPVSMGDGGGISGTDGSGGFVIKSGYCANQVSSISEAISSSLKLAANIAGTSDIVLLAARGITGNSNCFGALKWREIV